MFKFSKKKKKILLLLLVCGYRKWVIGLLNAKKSLFLLQGVDNVQNEESPCGEADDDDCEESFRACSQMSTNNTVHAFSRPRC